MSVSVRILTLDFTGLVLPWLEIEVYDICLCWLSPLFVSKLSLVDVFVRTMNEGLSLTHTRTYVHTPLIHTPSGMQFGRYSSTAPGVYLRTSLMASARTTSRGTDD